MSDQECYAAFLDWLSNNPLHQGKLEIHWSGCYDIDSKIHTFLFKYTARVVAQHQVDEAYCLILLKTYIEEVGARYPLEIGNNLTTSDKIQLILYLVSLRRL